LPSTAPGAPGPARPLARALTRDRAWALALVALLAAEIAYFSITVSGFFGGGTGLLALTEQFLDIGLLAFGETFVILAGDIDLSAGAMASLVGIVMAELWQQGLDIWLAAALALLVAALGGALNGLIVTRLELNSLLVTLASQFILGSVATALGGSSPPYGFPGSFVDLTGTGTLGPVPDQLVVFMVVALAVGLLISRTRYGRALVLVGFNAHAARYCGIDLRRTRVWAFIASAFMAGIAGIGVSGLFNAARDDIGDSLLLPAITVVVLGGVDIFGGKGRFSGVVLATFVLGFLTEGLLVRGDSSLTATMVTGVVLILGLVVKVTLDRQQWPDLLAASRRRPGPAHARVP
jgi:ribose/xylose/arabinose/galactoside ABC-type transport system permease subunit